MKIEDELLCRFIPRNDEVFYEEWKLTFVKTFNLAGLGGTVSTIAFPIAQNAESYNDFLKIMKLTENFFIENTKKSML